MEENELGRLRIAIEVMAGLIPGKPMPEHTKHFFIPSPVWYMEGDWKDKKEEAEMYIMRQYGTAMEYARMLMNPQRFNWVKLEWIYY